MSCKEVAPTNQSSSHKTRLNDLSYGIKIRTGLTSVLSQSTRLTDGRTDRQTPFSSLVRAGIPCNAEKLEQWVSVDETVADLTTKYPHLQFRKRFTNAANRAYPSHGHASVAFISGCLLCSVSFLLEANVRSLILGFIDYAAILMVMKLLRTGTCSHMAKIVNIFWQRAPILYSTARWLAPTIYDRCMLRWQRNLNT